MNLLRFCSTLIIFLFCAGLGRAAENATPRMLFVGNSLTLHGPSQKIGWAGNWGMAASAAEKDYAHRVVDAVAKRRGQQPEFRVVNVADFERAYATFDVAAKLKEAIAFQADTVVVAIGENVPGLKTAEAKAGFKESVVRLLELLRGERRVALYVRSSFWADAAKDAALNEACEKVGGVFVDIGALSKDEGNYARSERKIEHEGVGRHPGDKGMQAIADAIAAAILGTAKTSAPAQSQPPAEIAMFFQPPAEWAKDFGAFKSPLTFKDGSAVRTADDWGRRRAEILADWHGIMGAWPAVIERPKVDILESKHRENFTQHRIRMEIGPGQTGEGYLLIPDGPGPFPAVFVPYYDPETSAGLSDKPLRDFAYQLTKRGFVALSVGSPGGDARKPVLSAGAQCQPLSYLGYISANAWNALAARPEVDAKRIGIVGHSYGGKWSMFGACLWEKYACAVWSDPGIVFDETRQSINYQEPWYLGLDSALTRKPGLVRDDSPRTGAYRTLIERGHDLVEFQALMAPRPFLVSGGAEDPPKRWSVLNHLLAVNKLLGVEHRVAMTNRPDHAPTIESNEAIYRFFEWWLKR